MKTETSVKEEKKLSDEDILSLLSEKLRHKGKQFLHFLKTVTSIDWDEKGTGIIDKILNFSHITDFLKDILQPGKPIDHLESWYGKLSDSGPLSLVHAQRRPYVIKGRELEKVETQKGFEIRDQAETNLKVHPSQEPSQEPSQKTSQKASKETSQETSTLQSSLSPSQGRIKSTPVQEIIIPPGIPDKSPQEVNLKKKWQRLTT